MGEELCGRCEVQHYRGQPQLRKDAARAAAASGPAAVAAARIPSSPAAVLLLPPPGARYATRHACFVTLAARAEAMESLVAPSRCLRRGEIQEQFSCAGFRFASVGAHVAEAGSICSRCYCIQPSC